MTARCSAVRTFPPSPPNFRQLRHTPRDQFDIADNGQLLDTSFTFGPVWTQWPKLPKCASKCEPAWMKMVDSIVSLRFGQKSAIFHGAGPFYWLKNIIHTQPPVSVVKIVLLRTITIMELLCTTLLMTMAVMLRPWKYENLEGDQKYLEISVFHVCRAVFSKGIKCYPGEHERESPGNLLRFL